MASRTTELRIERPVAAVWSTIWNEGGWPDLTTSIEAVEVIDPGDRHGNGRLRRIHQHRRFWDATIMMERTDRVAHHRSVDAVVHHHRADLRHGWHLDLREADPGATLVSLDETVEVDQARYPGEARLLTARLLALRPALLTALRDAQD